MNNQMNKKNAVGAFIALLTCALAGQALPQGQEMEYKSNADGLAKIRSSCQSTIAAVPAMALTIEADNLGPGGCSELNDLLGAITYLRGRQDVDSHRLGIWGGSYGGFMTALGLARASDALAAGVDYSGIQ